MYKTNQYYHSVKATIRAIGNGSDKTTNILDVAGEIMEAFSQDRLTSGEYSYLMNNVQKVAVKSL